MKIGLISDIHANLTALQAVLPQLQDCDVVLCAGDIVGYYAQPNEVCHVLRANNILCVRGNHDAYVLGALTPAPSKREAYRTDCMREVLTDENRQWPAALPVERHLHYDDVNFWLRHASPWDEETYLYPDSVRLQDVSLEAGTVLVVGHTHHPLRYDVKGGVLVNPGSVGQPRDWNPAASFATFCTESRKTDFHRVSYDVSLVQEQLRQQNWPESSISILSRQRE